MGPCKKVEASPELKIDSKTKLVEEKESTGNGQVKVDQPTTVKLDDTSIPIRGYKFPPIMPPHPPMGRSTGILDDDRYDSHPSFSPIIIPDRRTKAKSNRRPSPIKDAKSYREVFNIEEDESTWIDYDKKFYLTTFNKELYVVNTYFLPVDFQRYAWLFAQTEDEWFAMPDRKTLMTMRKLGLQALPQNKEYFSGALHPRIVAGQAMNLDCLGEERLDFIWTNCHEVHPDDLDIPAEVVTAEEEKGKGKEKEKLDDSWSFRDDSVIFGESGRVRRRNCEKCKTRFEDLFQEVGLIYLSVLKAECDGYGAVYSYKTHASREQAAATAFYDAGAHGWSTLFFCAVRADTEFLGWKGKIVQCNDRNDVLLPTDGEVIRVHM